MAKKKRQRKEAPKKVCNICKKEQHALNNFYASNSPMFADGRVPICKTCLVNEVDEFDPKLESLFRILRMIDKPFIYKYWEAAKKSKHNTVSAYMKNINSLPQCKDLTFEDGDVLEPKDGLNKFTDQTVAVVDEQYVEQLNEFEVTDEMLKRWGKGYKKAEIMKLENAYQNLVDEHEFTKPQDKELCRQIAIIDLTLNDLLRQGKVSEYSKLTETKLKLMQSLNLRLIDRKTENEKKGIKSFGQLVAEVEKKGFIVPKPVTEDQDIVDKTILYMANFTRQLLQLEKLTEPPVDTPSVDGDDE